MTALHADQIVDRYLKRLAAELSDVPSAQRRELLDEVRSHIAEARTALPEETDAEIFNLLDRIGDPAELAAEARERLGIRPAAPVRAGLLEVAALILTPFLWPVGVILLWYSPAWNWRDKVIGTLVPPGGYGGVFIAMLYSVGTSRPHSCLTTYDTAGHIAASNCPSSPAWLQVLVVSIFVVLFLSPILSAVYLGLRLDNRHQGRFFRDPATASQGY